MDIVVVVPPTTKSPFIEISPPTTKSPLMSTLLLKDISSSVFNAIVITFVSSCVNVILSPAAKFWDKSP